MNYVCTHTNGSSVDFCIWTGGVGLSGEKRGSQNETTNVSSTFQFLKSYPGRRDAFFTGRGTGKKPYPPLGKGGVLYAAALGLLQGTFPETNFPIRQICRARPRRPLFYGVCLWQLGPATRAWCQFFLPRRRSRSSVRTSRPAKWLELRAWASATTCRPLTRITAAAAPACEPRRWRLCESRDSTMARSAPPARRPA